MDGTLWGRAKTPTPQMCLANRGNRIQLTDSSFFDLVGFDQGGSVLEVKFTFGPGALRATFGGEYALTKPPLL